MIKLGAIKSYNAIDEFLKINGNEIPFVCLKNVELYQEKTMIYLKVDLDIFKTFFSENNSYRGAFIISFTFQNDVYETAFTIFRYKHDISTQSVNIELLARKNIITNKKHNSPQLKEE